MPKCEFESHFGHGNNDSIGCLKFFSFIMNDMDLRQFFYFHVLSLSP